MTGKKRWGVVSVLLGLFFVAGCMGSDAGHTGVQDRVQENQHFVLKDLKGEEVRSEELFKNHKAILLNFWATWCPPCREEIPDLIKLQEKYKDRGFTVLGVDVGESQARVASFVAKSGINYPVVLDVDQGVSEAYRVVGVPTSYLVSSEGKILGEYHAVTPQLTADVEKSIAS